MGLIKEEGKSNLFSTLDEISNLMVKEIDNDQEIKRLLFYLTGSPLASQGRDNSGELFYQRNTTLSLTKPQKIDVSKNKDKSKIIETQKILYNTAWQNEKISEEYPIMFVHSYQDEVDLVGENIFMIDILIPIGYDSLKDGTTRLHRLMQRIADIFHNAVADEESAKLIGDCKFKISNRFSIREEKIVKSKDILACTIPISVTCVNARSIGGGIV